MVLGTRENIINALFRVASKNPDKKSITITEIAEEAGISRQALYQKHYHNVEDIFNDIHNSITDEVSMTLENVLSKGRAASIYDIIADDLLPVIYKHRQWGKILYHTSIDSDWRDFLMGKYLSLLESRISNSNDNGVLPYKSLSRIMINFVSCIVSEWISEDFPEPPEVFAKKFKRLIETPPKDLIDII